MRADKYQQRKEVWGDRSIVDVPKDIAICPECGASIRVDVYEIEQLENGHWGVDQLGSGVHIWCAADEAGESNIGHYNMPYVDWLPLDKPVIDWLNKTYDFDPF
jgi:hypothetical protein